MLRGYRAAQAGCHCSRLRSGWTQSRPLPLWPRSTASASPMSIGVGPDTFRAPGRVESGSIRIDAALPATAVLKAPAAGTAPADRIHHERSPIDMFWILALVALIFIGIVAVTVLSFTLHLLFSPWLLLLALGVLV